MSRLLLAFIFIAFAKIALSQTCPPGSSLSSSAPVCVKSTSAFCPPGMGEPIEQARCQGPALCPVGYGKPFDGGCIGPALCPVGYRFDTSMNSMDSGGEEGFFIDPCVMELPMNGFSLKGIPIH